MIGEKLGIMLDTMAKFEERGDGDREIKASRVFGVQRRRERATEGVSRYISTFQ